jgi:membrane protease YdiL (CAAX protease family)
MLPPEQFAQVERQLAAMPLMPFWLGVLSSLIAGPTINAIAGFGEELGWRGLLQKTLAGMGFWRSSLVIGIIWGFWHAPLIYLGHNYPGYPVLGIFMMTAFTVLLAPIFSYVRLRARSVVAAAVIHGSLNATAGLSVIVVRGGDVLTIGVTGLAGLIVLALVNVAVFLHDRYVAREPISAIISGEVSS